MMFMILRNGVTPIFKLRVLSNPSIGRSGNALVIVWVIFQVMLGLRASAADEPVVFSRNVAPILLQQCTACHNAKKAEGGYRIDTFAELLKPGDSGAVPVKAADGDTSELLRRLVTDDVSERMPAESDPLSADEIQTIKRWIESGGDFDAADPNQSLNFVIPPPRHQEPPQNYPSAIPVTALAFSPDGSQVLVGGYYEITVWDVEDATLVRRISNVGQRVFSVAFSVDGKSLAVACGEPGRSGEVRLLDFATGEVKAVIARSTDVALDVAFKPDGSQVAVAGADSLIQVIDLQTLQSVRTLAGHADWVTAVAWSNDGKRLVSGSRDKSAKVFDAETGDLLTSYQGHGAAVRGVKMSPDGLHVFSSGSDKQLHRWETTGAKRIASVPLGGEGYHVNGNETTLFIPSSDKRLVQVDLAKNSVEKAFVGLTDWVMACDWHRETGQVVGGSFGGEIAVWNIADGVMVNRWVAKP